MSLNQHINMSKQSALFFIFFALFILSYQLRAVEVKDLYQASAPVASQSLAERRKATQAAMLNMLIKVSGQINIAEQPLFRQAINQPDNYFLQYRYETNNEQRLLLVDFDEAKVNKLFQQAEQPLWGRLRPQVLVWLVVESALERHIVSATDESELTAIIRASANKRGLPLIMPLMDLDDIEAVNTAEFWGRFSDPILAASERYQAEKVIVIRVSDGSLLPLEQHNDVENCQPLCQQKQYGLDWQLITGYQPSSQLYQGSDKVKLLAQMVDDIADFIYQQYALSTDTNNQFFIDINNIATLEDYVKAFDFLSNLSSVQSVVLVAAKGQHRRFKLNILGAKDALMASLGFSRQLQQQVELFAGDEVNDIPVYLWRH